MCITYRHDVTLTVNVVLNPDTISQPIFQDPHVERYRYSDIESQLGIDRNGLVALALLLGCDFIPKGVSGIGMASAVKLLECLKGRNVLERYFFFFFLAHLSMKCSE